MKRALLHAGKFLHVVDDDNRLDLSDIAFMIIMGKIAFASRLDFPAVVTLATVLINKMHKRQQGNSLSEVKEQVSQVRDTMSKIEPVIETIKGSLK